jgi:MSHA biogenesis protein MshN
MGVAAMSVINTMLKDLERRGADSESAGDKILGGLSSGSNHYQENESSSKAYLVSLISAIIIVVLVIGGYYLSPYKLVDLASGKAEQRSEPAAPVVATKAVEPAPQKKAEPVVSDKGAGVQAETAQNQIRSTETQMTQSHETAPKLQKTTSPSSLAAVAATVPVAAEVVNRTEPTPPVQKKPDVKTASAQVASAVSVQPAAAEEDNVETTAESLHVVTKERREFTPDEKSRQSYAAAMSLYDQGRKQEAKSSLTQALTFNSGNADASRLLTVIYLEDGRADLAADTVESGLKMHGNDQSLLRLYVQTLVKLKKYNEAIAVMGKRVQLTSPEDMGYLAGLYQKNNDNLEAVKYYAEALQLVPSKSVWWLGQGISLEILQQYKEALQSYQKSVSTGELSTRLMEYAVSRMNVVKQHIADSKS